MTTLQLGQAKVNVSTDAVSLIEHEPGAFGKKTVFIFADHKPLL